MIQGKVYRSSYIVHEYCNKAAVQLVWKLPLTESPRMLSISRAKWLNSHFFMHSINFFQEQSVSLISHLENIAYIVCSGSLRFAVWIASTTLPLLSFSKWVPRHRYWDATRLIMFLVPLMGTGKCWRAIIFISVAPKKKGERTMKGHVIYTMSTSKEVCLCSLHKFTNEMIE